MMKKLLLSLGTVAAIVAPVVSVVACGSTTTPKVTSKDMVKVLKELKDNDKKLVIAAPLLETRKDTDLKKIDGVKDVASLTKLMTSITAEINAAPKLKSVSTNLLIKNPMIAKLGPKDGTLASVVNAKYSQTITFTVTVAGSLYGVVIKANSKVTLSRDEAIDLKTYWINGNKFSANNPDPIGIVAFMGGVSANTIN